MSEPTLEELADQLNGGPDLTPEEWDRVIAALREHTKTGQHAWHSPDAPVEHCIACRDHSQKARIAKLEKAVAFFSLDGCHCNEVDTCEGHIALEEKKNGPPPGIKGGP